MGREDPGSQLRDRVDWTVQPHQEVGGVQGHAEGSEIQPVQQIEQLGGSEVRMSFDGHGQVELEQTRGEKRQDLERGRDLVWPGNVGSEAIVPITHIGPCVPAIQSKRRPRY